MTISTTSNYVLPHHTPGESGRLRLMAMLLDGMSRRHIEGLGVAPGWHVLEVGAGYGSMSAWLSARVGPGGRVRCTDLDLTLMDGLMAPNLTVEKLDIVNDPMPANTYDLVIIRALLHHLPARDAVVRRLYDTVRPGGWLLMIEPDFRASETVTDPDLARLWKGFRAWGTHHEIDYSIAERLPRLAASMKPATVGGETTRTAFNGGSPWAVYWLRGLEEIGKQMVDEGHVTQAELDAARGKLADPAVWTDSSDFTAVWAQKP